MVVLSLLLFYSFRVLLIKEPLDYNQSIILAFNLESIF